MNMVLLFSLKHQKFNGIQAKDIRGEKNNHQVKCDFHLPCLPQRPAFSPSTATLPERDGHRDHSEYKSKLFIYVHN